MRQKLLHWQITMIKYFVGPTLKRKKLRIRSLHHKQRFYREHLTSAPHTHDMITTQDKAQKSHIVNFLQRNQNITGSSMALWQKITKHIYKKKTAQDTQKKRPHEIADSLKRQNKVKLSFPTINKRSYDRVGGIESVFAENFHNADLMRFTDWKHLSLGTTS